VRQKTRHLRERDAAKEVARLELQLTQQDVAVLQSQLDEGKINLREVERARLEENEKWMLYLDANFQRQQAQLDFAGKLPATSIRSGSNSCQRVQRAAKTKIRWRCSWKR